MKLNLKERRLELKLTLEEVGNLIGVGKSTVRKWETGDIENMRRDNIVKLAKALKVSPIDIMGIEETMTEDTAVTLYQDIIDNLDELSEHNAPLLNNFIDEIIKEQNGKTTVIPESFRGQFKLSFARQKNVLKYIENQISLQQNGKDKVINLGTYKNEPVSNVKVSGYASAGTGETLLDEVSFDVELKGNVPTHDIALQVNGDSMTPIFEDKEIIFIEKVNEINNGQIGVFIIDGEAYVKKVFIEDDRIRLVSLNKKYNDLYFYNNESIELVGKVIL